MFLKDSDQNSRTFQGVCEHVNKARSILSSQAMKDSGPWTAELQVEQESATQGVFLTAAWQLLLDVFM